jgi:hypothetical protein
LKKKKPLKVYEKPHGDCWITALGNVYNSDILASGAYDDKINLYTFDKSKSTLNPFYSLPCVNYIINYFIIINTIKGNMKLSVLTIFRNIGVK